MSYPVKDMDMNKPRKQFRPKNDIHMNWGKLLHSKECVRMELDVLPEITNLIMSVMLYRHSQYWVKTNKSTRHVRQNRQDLNYVNWEKLVHPKQRVRMVLNVVEWKRNLVAHGDAREEKWRGKRQMEWVASSLQLDSEHSPSSVTTNNKNMRHSG